MNTATVLVFEDMTVCSGRKDTHVVLDISEGAYAHTKGTHTLYRYTKRTLQELFS